MKKAIYKEVSEDIQRKIENKEYENDRLPSERQLSKEYGINRITLRKALKDLYNTGLIIKLGTKGTFITSHKPVSMPMSAKKIAYFQISRSHQLDLYHGTILTSIQQELKKTHSTLFFYTISSAAEVQRYLTANSLYKGLDGIIIAGGVTPMMLKQVKRFKLPLVLIGRLNHPDEIENTVDQVSDDPIDYTSKAINFLLKQGCTRIAFIDSPAYQWSIMAQQTYMKLLDAHDIEYCESLVLRSPNQDMREAYDLSEKILKLKPDGIFVRNEEIARGLYDGLSAHGVIVGKDIKWTSIGHKGDNVEHLNLTRLVIDPQKIGLAALEILLTRLRTPRHKIIKEIIPHRFKSRSQQ